MENHVLSLIVVGVLCAGGGFESLAKSHGDGQAAARMARYNVVWDSPSKDASGVMSTGNGDLAVGVYAIENGDLYLLLSKNDAFNSHGDLYKTGKVRISLSPSPFVAGKPFRQTLDLSTASVQIEADGVKILIWADANRPLYHVEINSPHELAVTAQPEFWKRYDAGKRLDPTPDVRLERGNKVLWYFSVGDKSGYRDRLERNSKGTWKIDNPESILPDLFRFNTFGGLMEIRGRKTEGRGQKTENGVLTGKGKQFDIRIHSLTLQTPKPETEWVDAIEKLAAQPVDLAADWSRHCQWWQSFWDRGWIMASDRTVAPAEREKFKGEANAEGMRDEKDGAALVAQSYNFFRFAMGAQSRGRFAAKFNGGLFTQQYRISERFTKGKDAKGILKTYPFATQTPGGAWLTAEDYRPWTSYYTGQNQRLLYWPMLMSGDFDMLKPYFDHYWNVLPMRQAITKAYFGHEGAFYRENVNPVTGDDSWSMPPKVKPGEKYEGGHLTYHYTSGLESLAIMLDYVNFTGDTKFRDERLVPYAREILLFFDKHYPRDPNGKLHMEPSQALECWWVTINPVTDVAGLRFCMDELLAMKAGSAEDQATWKRFRAEIPEVPTQLLDGRLAVVPADKWAHGRIHPGNSRIPWTPEELKKYTETVMDRTRSHVGESPEIYALFPFRCYGLALGSKDVAQWTMKTRYARDTFGNRCWTQDQIGHAMAGNAAEAAAGLVQRFRWAANAVRMPLYGNEVTDGIPDWDHFGSGAIALQRMLVQESEITNQKSKIYLLPAWPSEWDADFKLHLSGGAVLTGVVKDGKLAAWDITPASRKADVVVCEPVSIASQSMNDSKKAIKQ